MTEPSTRTRKITAAVVVLVALLVLALLSPGWHPQANDHALAVDTTSDNTQNVSDCVALAGDDTATACEEASVDFVARGPRRTDAAPGRTRATVDDLVAQSIALGLGDRVISRSDPQDFTSFGYPGPGEPASEPDLIAMNLPGSAGLFSISGTKDPLTVHGLVPGPVTLGHVVRSGSGGSGGSAGTSGAGGRSFVPNEQTGGETPGNAPNGGDEGSGGSGQGDGSNGTTPGGWTPPTGGSPTLLIGGPATLTQQTPPVETVPGPSALALAGLGVALASFCRRRPIPRT